MNSGLLSIGQFAQATGLTIVTVRHYDATGVLQPARVDRFTGYRYYTAEQVQQARLIRLLRELDIPVRRLPDLLAAIAAGRDITPELTRQVDRLSGRLDMQRRVLDHIRAQLLRDGTEQRHQVQMRNMPAGPALATTGRVLASGSVRFCVESLTRLNMLAERELLTVDRSMFSRIYGLVSHTSETEIQACLPFTPSGARPRYLPDDVEIVEIPPGQMATVRVRGSAARFPAVLDANAAAWDWIHDQGLESTGPAYEIYRNWVGELGHPDNILEVGFPVTSSTAT